MLHKRINFFKLSDLIKRIYLLSFRESPFERSNRRSNLARFWENRLGRSIGYEKAGTGILKDSVIPVIFLYQQVYQNLPFIICYLKLCVEY